jgi:hypothetical protein
MVSHARTNELMTMQLELPFAVPEHSRIDPWKMSDLLYDLAVTFGVISLDNENMLVFGEWGGKGSSDYLRENVKVRFESEEKFQSISQQLQLCRTILGANSF